VNPTEHTVKTPSHRTGLFAKLASLLGAKGSSVPSSIAGKDDTYVRHHAKASSAGSTSGGGSDLGSFGRGSFAVLCVVLALGFSATFALSAQANPGIDTWWGNSAAGGKTVGGQLGVAPLGVAVDDASGNVYVADANNNRIERFSGEGAFIAAWGRDVDATGGTGGYEICLAPVGAEVDHCKAAAASTGLGGELSGPAGIAVDQSTHNVYVVDAGNNRVQEFTAAGGFIRAFGKDVVLSGPDDSAANEQQSIKVSATSGTFSLTFAGQTASAIPFNVSAAALETQLNALSSIAGVGGSVSVSGGPGDATGTTPYTITFGGALGGDDVAQISSSAAGLAGGSPSSAVAVSTSVPGGASEVCSATAGDVCKAGSADSDNGALKSPGYPTVAPTGAPNAGDVLIADAGNNRVSEFKANGEFVRAFGWDVAAAGPGNTGTAFEVCSATGGDTCKAGSTGSGIGQFAAGTPNRIAEDAVGRIYTVEPTGNFRVQRFLLPGNVPTPQGEFAAGVLHGSSTKPGGGTLLDPLSPPKDNTTEIAVDDAGNVYAVKAFLAGPTAAEKALLEAQGSPPVKVEGPNQVKWQQRILRIDPVSEAVGAIMAANPGILSGVGFENVAGLAVGAAGTPLYAATAATSASGGGLSSYFSGLPRSRVWRLNEIAGPGATDVHAEGIGASVAVLRATVTPAQVAAVKKLESAYRFEYTEDGVSWTAAPAIDALVGNGSDGGTSPTCPTPQAASCEVSQAIAGLTPNTTYQLRLAIYSQFDKGQTKRIVSAPFTTIVEPPATTTGTATWSSPADTEPSLYLVGTVNPGGDASTYQFQYVDDATFQADVRKAEEEGKGPAEIAEAGFSRSTPTPAIPASAGKGLETVTVHAVLAGLDPSLTYHYRLVASNSAGTAEGVERSAAPPSAGQRFYELVSAGDSWGMGVDSTQGEAVAAGGDRAGFAAQIFGDDPRSVPSFLNQYVSERGPGGWEVAETSAPAERSLSESNLMWAADLGKALRAVGSPAERDRSEAQFTFANLDGGLQEASPQLVPLTRSGIRHYALRGASSDLSTYVFGFGSASPNQASVTLLPGEPPVNGGTGSQSNLYEITGAGGPSPTPLAILNRADGAGGAIIGGVCGATIAGGAHPVSSDGSVVYFNISPEAPGSGVCPNTPPPRRLFKRIDNETTVEVSAPQCSPTPTCPGSPAGDDVFAGASADGQVVFFTTVRQLVNADTDSTADLYAYDENPPAGQPKLVQVSAGENVGAHTAGSGAEVLLQLPAEGGVLDSAEDGSRIYFVAKGAIAGANGEGGSPTSGGKNLYVWERDAAHPTGRIAFIAGLTAADASEWRQGENKQARALPDPGDGSGDGHALLFSTTAKLTAADLDSSPDVYLYDDSAGPGSALTCLTCAGNGAFEAILPFRSFSAAGLSRPDYAAEQPVASADLSTVVFATQERLSPEDENQTWDAYAWHEGAVELISRGSERFGIPLSFEQVAISPDGRNAFFVTAAPLVGSDTNGAYDLYDARIGGGFPEAARATACEEEVGCHGALPPPPPTLPGPGSSAPGPGNQPAPVPCKKGKVRRGGKCVKKPSHHKKKATKGKHHHRRKHHHKRGKNQHKQTSHHRGARG
jgi:NHL repeat-containing protein